jgi:protein involved in polysaccharide export with SLBB domain
MINVMSKMSTMPIKKFIAGCCFAAITALCTGQTNLSYPGGNATTVGAECAKNPALPGCSEQQQAPKTPTSTRTFTDQSQFPSGDRVAGESSQERIAHQPFLPPQKEEATEFQLFVTSSVGRELPLFGYSLFEQVPTTFAPIDRVPVTAEYVIGPGDELLIRAWGQIEMDARVVVDRGGTIYLPRVGSIEVAGVQYRQLTEFLKTNIGRIFRNFDLTVSLGKLRSIQIFVVGQARRPGVYTVSSLSSLVNALFASGGPSNRGSMRRIELKRNGHTITVFDLYDLLLKGDKSKDVVLQPGDVIYIPPVGPQVGIFGSVNLPAIYELAGTATLKEQLETAGGLTSVADGERVIVERIEDHTLRKVEEFRLDEQGMNREVHDGDMIRVFPITPRFGNAITLRGNVAEPGRYPWRDGMRIRDLIPDRKFLITRDFWDRQNLAAGERRFGATQEDVDKKIRSSKQDQVTGPRERDPLRQLQSSARDENEDLKAEELKNDVKRNAPEINWEYAVIQRLDRVSLTTRLIPFNLRLAVLEGVEAENKLLEAGDIVTIFSQEDISVGLEKRSKFVRLEGEFKSPGIYKVEPGETLRDVVNKAGGLSAEAYLFGAEFTRESVRKEQQHSLDEMLRNLEQEMQRKTAIAQSRPDQQSNILAQAQTDQAFIDKLRAVKPSGRIVLELQPSKVEATVIPNLSLEDGDRFIVPCKSSTVTVVGAVYNQTSFLFKEGTPIKKYLAMAGNGNRLADSKHMFLLRADGSVVSKDQTSSTWSDGFGSIRALPGDMLVVPTQLDKGAFMRGLKDWTQVISQFGLGVAAVAVLTN